MESFLGPIRRKKRTIRTRRAQNSTPSSPIQPLPSHECLSPRKQPPTSSSSAFPPSSRNQPPQPSVTPTSKDHRSTSTRFKEDRCGATYTVGSKNEQKNKNPKQAKKMGKSQRLKISKGSISSSTSFRDDLCPTTYPVGSKNEHGKNSPKKEKNVRESQGRKNPIRKASQKAQLALILEFVQSREMSVSEGLRKAMETLQLSDPVKKLVEDYMANLKTKEEVNEVVAAALVLGSLFEASKDSLEGKIMEANDLVSGMKESRSLEQDIDNLRVILHCKDEIYTTINEISDGGLSIQEGLEKLIKLVDGRLTNKDA